MLGIGGFKQRMVDPARALPGRDAPMPVRNVHHVNGHPITGEFTGMQTVQFGMGCFWGAERKFWTLPGVFTTAVGYAGGITQNATYREVCSARPAMPKWCWWVHDPAQVSFDALLKTFWESQTRPRACAGQRPRAPSTVPIYCSTQAQFDAAIASRDAYQQRLVEAGLGEITTEIVFPAPPFYYAEDEHQQYLSKNPMGYCGLGGTGVSCQIGTGA